jgi:acyl-CoA hydrolase
MDLFTLVRPEHLSHHGYLFGGCMLKWVDEYAWLAAAREFPGYMLVTVAMDKIEFRKPVKNGAILRFTVTRVRQGTTSVTYAVNVHADEPGAAHEKLVFTTSVTFCCVDAHGRKRVLPATPPARGTAQQ